MEVVLCVPVHVARVRRIECILYHTFQKIADFGLSHDMDEDYYYKPKGGMIPVKWTAPEAVLYKKYTTKSDVWSYGMVMYEIWSLGHKPFEEFNINQVSNFTLQLTSRHSTFTLVLWLSCDNNSCLR